MVGEDIILERLKLLNEYVGDLRDLQGTDYATFSGNKLIHRTVERTLHLAVEACIDIGQQLIAYEGYRTPATYRDVFVILGEEGVIPAALQPKLVEMAQFRNLIVHDYARIDLAVVFGILNRRLGDFDEFARAVADYLRRS